MRLPMLAVLCAMGCGPGGPLAGSKRPEAEAARIVARSSGPPGGNERDACPQTSGGRRLDRYRVVTLDESLKKKLGEAAREQWILCLYGD